MKNGTNPRERIKQLEAELARVKMLGRTRREPIEGFGGVIQRWRETKGIGLRELATRADVSAGLISRLEQDPQADPRLNTITKLAAALGTNASGLLAEL